MVTYEKKGCIQHGVETAEQMVKEYSGVVKG
jgi:hypothetical protein